MGKYIWIFLGANFAIGIAIAVILNFLNISANIGGVAAAIGASYFVGSRFVVDKGREPSGKEKHQFAVNSIIFLTIIAVLIFVVVMQFLPGPNTIAGLFFLLKSPIILGALLLMSVIYYFAIKHFFGFGAAAKYKSKN